MTLKQKKSPLTHPYFHDIIHLIRDKKVSNEYYEV